MIQDLIKKAIDDGKLDAVSAAANLAQVGTMIGLYAAQASVAKATIKERNDRLRYFTENVSKWAGRALDAMNFELEVIGYDEKRMAEQNFLMIGNHMSYVDILVTSSVEPIVFVTSVDMGETAFLGQMAELGGSIFVERRNRSQIGRDLGVIADTLRSGFNVMIYPEGTSSDGQKLLPFKKSLFMSAVEAETDILPVCLKYVEIDGEPFGPENAHKVCWYGDMTFAPHFLQMLKLKRVKAELHFLEPIKVTKESTRHELAEKAYNAIHAAYFGGPNVAWSMPAAVVEGSELESETKEASGLS